MPIPIQARTLKPLRQKLQLLLRLSLWLQILQPLLQCNSSLFIFPRLVYISQLSPRLLDLSVWPSPVFLCISGQRLLERPDFFSFHWSGELSFVLLLRLLSCSNVRNHYLWSGLPLVYCNRCCRCFLPLKCMFFPCLILFFFTLSHLWPILHCPHIQWTGLDSIDWSRCWLFSSPD